MIVLIFFVATVDLYISFRIENCRRAMVIAKEQLHVPRVISAEDFASPALDELSSMTYLSYFVKHESPGYYHTLNWACKQLRTTNITNLTVSVIVRYSVSACVQRHLSQTGESDESKRLVTFDLMLDGLSYNHSILILG